LKASCLAAASWIALAIANLKKRIESYDPLLSFLPNPGLLLNLKKRIESHPHPRPRDTSPELESQKENWKIYHGESYYLSPGPTNLKKRIESLSHVTLVTAPPKSRISKRELKVFNLLGHSLHLILHQNLKKRIERELGLDRRAYREDVLNLKKRIER